MATGQFGKIGVAVDCILPMLRTSDSVHAHVNILMRDHDAWLRAEALAEFFRAALGEEFSRDGNGYYSANFTIGVDA